MTNLGKNQLLLDENINQFFNNIPIPSYVWQKTKNDFILVDFNNAAKQPTKGKIKDLLHEKASVIYDGRPDILKAMNKCFDEHESISDRYDYIVKATGQKIYNSLNIHHLPPDLIIVHIKNITEWVLAEEKLKNSEEKYKQLFERAPIPIVISDLKGTIIDCNIFTEKHFGYKKQNLIGKNYFELGSYSPTLIPTLRTRLSQLKQGKPIKNIEIELSKKDGSKSWVSNQMSLVNIDNITMVQSFVIDVTERKNFEQKIKRKLDYEKFISTISSRLVNTNDIDKAISKSLLEMGVLIGATRAFILLFTEEESLEFYVQEWCTEETKPFILSSTNINQTTYPWIFKLSKKQELIHIKDSSELPEEAINLKIEMDRLNINSLLAFPIKIKEDSTGYIGFDTVNQISKWDEIDFDILRAMSDIIGNALERKWAEETLKGSHQLLAGIISSLTEVIYLVDNHFNVIWANNVAKQCFGAQIAGQKCYRIFARRGNPCNECLARETFEDGKIHEKEEILTNIDGKKKLYWCTSSIAGFNIEGERELAILILRDITESKKVEESLTESQNRLRSLNVSLMEKVEERTKELKMSEEMYKKILNDLDVGYYKGEFKGILLMHNSALNAILGLDTSVSLVGSQLTRFFSDLNAQKRYYDELLENGYITNFKAQLKNSKGEIINVQLNSHLIRDHEGNPKEVEGTVIKFIKEASMRQ